MFLSCEEIELILVASDCISHHWDCFTFNMQVTFISEKLPWLIMSNLLLAYEFSEIGQQVLSNMVASQYLV